MVNFSWNPYNLPLDRPFVLHSAREEKIIRPILVYVVFPHEHSLKHLAGQSYLSNLDQDCITALSDSNEIVGFSELDPQFKDLLVWPCWKRYKGNPIAEELREFYKQKQLKFRNDMLERNRGKNSRNNRDNFIVRLEQEIAKLNDENWGWDPLFDNGVYIGE